MDKTLEIVVAAAVLMMIGAILFFMLSDSSTGFTETTDAQVTKSQCELWKTQGDCADHVLECPEVCAPGDVVACQALDENQCASPSNSCQMLNGRCTTT